MQLACFAFIKRIWNSDKETLASIVDYFSHLKDYKYTLVLFPEGTDLTEHTRKGSNRHADKYSLPVRYYFCSHIQIDIFSY